MATSSDKANAAEKADATPGAPVYRAVMGLDNSFHAPDGLVVQGVLRDAVDGFVVAHRGETIEVPTDHPVLVEVQMAVQLGRATPATAPAATA